MAAPAIGLFTKMLASTAGKVAVAGAVGSSLAKKKIDDIKPTVAEKNLERKQVDQLASADADVARARSMLGKSGRRSLVSNVGGSKGV